MTEEYQYLLVDAQVLPEVFKKVVQAKMYLAQGRAKSASQAAQMAGISRSAFYKYKESVYMYDERMSNNLLTIHLTLEDRPGVLSGLLSEIYRAHANVITVNQNIPVDGVAAATVSVRIGKGAHPRTQLLEMLSSLDGVVEAKSI